MKSTTTILANLGRAQASGDPTFVTQGCLDRLRERLAARPEWDREGVVRQARLAAQGRPARVVRVVQRYGVAAYAGIPYSVDIDIQPPKW